MAQGNGHQQSICKFQGGIRKRFFFTMGMVSHWDGTQERGNPHPWRFSSLTQTRSWATWSNLPLDLILRHALLWAEGSARDAQRFSSALNIPSLPIILRYSFLEKKRSNHNWGNLDHRDSSPVGRIKLKHPTHLPHTGTSYFVQRCRLIKSNARSATNANLSQHLSQPQFEKKIHHSCVWLHLLHSQNWMLYQHLEGNGGTIGRY